MISWGGKANSKLNEGMSHRFEEAEEEEEQRNMPPLPRLIVILATPSPAAFIDSVRIKGI